MVWVLVERRGWLRCGSLRDDNFRWHRLAAVRTQLRNCWCRCGDNKRRDGLLNNRSGLRNRRSNFYNWRDDGRGLRFRCALEALSWRYEAPQLVEFRINLFHAVSPCCARLGDMHSLRHLVRKEFFDCGHDTFHPVHLAFWSRATATCQSRTVAYPTYCSGRVSEVDLRAWSGTAFVALLLCRAPLHPFPQANLFATQSKSSRTSDRDLFRRGAFNGLRALVNLFQSSTMPFVPGKSAATRPSRICTMMPTPRKPGCLTLCPILNMTVLPTCWSLSCSTFSKSVQLLATPKYYSTARSSLDSRRRTQNLTSASDPSPQTRTRR